MKNHRRNILLLFLPLLILFSAAGLLSAAPAASPAPLKRKTPDRDLRAIAMIVTSYFSHKHYQPSPLTREKCDLAVCAYFRSLDPGKMFLTRSDVDELLKDREHFAGDFSRGELSFAFRAFNRIQERFSMYRDFAHRLLSGDLRKLVNGDETLESDRKNAPWPKDIPALYDLWRKKLINDYILILLSDRAAAAKRADAIAAGVKPGSKDPPPPPETRPEERIFRRLDQIHRYYAGMENIEVLEIFLNALAASYDPHSAYLSPATDEDFNIDMSLKLIGIGAVLTSEDGYIKIVEIIPGGPADKDGRLRAGDRIVAVAQEKGETVDLVNMPLTKAVHWIRGRVNTKLTLSVIPAGSSPHSVPVPIRLVRAEIVVKDHEAKGEIRSVTAPDGTRRTLGIITIPSFYMDFSAAKNGNPDYKRASLDVRKILKKFQANPEKVDGILIDLRANGGGSLPDSVAMTGLFIKDGPVVQVRNPVSTETFDDQDGGELVYAGPLAVLVNRLSASASEIFAGAIRDYGRGIIIGDSKTHGKGTVQVIDPLDPLIVYLTGKSVKAGSVKVTNAKFYRVNGESTQLKGVTPDIIFPSFFDAMDLGEDKLEHPLRWDTIASSCFHRVPGCGKLENAIPRLRMASEKRMASDPGFLRLKNDISRFKKIHDEKFVSLNLEKRWKQYLDEQKITEEQNRLFRLDNNTASSREKDSAGAKDTTKDLYLNEALNILSDLVAVMDAKP